MADTPSARKQIGVIMFSDGQPVKGSSLTFVSDRAALIAEAETQGFEVVVVDDRAELYVK